MLSKKIIKFFNEKQIKQAQANISYPTASKKITTELMGKQVVVILLFDKMAQII